MRSILDPRPDLIQVEPFKPSAIYIHDKPAECGACPYNAIGSGFCPDWAPPTARIAFLLEAAGDNEIIDKEPLVGAAGHVFNKNFVFKLGYTRADILIANTLRCHPPDNHYPTGLMRGSAEKFCRQWDNVGGKGFDLPGLNVFKPDTFLVTIHPSAVNRTWSLLRVVQSDVAKAYRMMEAGRRVVVLMGEKAFHLIKPDISGSVMKWRGHYGPLDWKREVQDRYETKRPS